MKIKLTKTAVEAVDPSDKDIVLRDTALAGFECKITPKGKRVYSVRYRTTGGVQRHPNIGVHGVITCEQARTEALKLLADVAHGGDPSARRKEERAAGTVEELSSRFATEHLPRLSPSTAKEYRRLIERHIKPALGKMKIKDVTVADVSSLHHKMRGTPRSANQTLSVLSRMMTQAIRWQLRETNPCKAAVDKYPETQRERFLSEPELSRLGAVLDEAELQGTELHGVIRAIRLLALTGRRLGEILSLRWVDVDFELGLLHLRDTKTGPMDITLGAPTVALLQGFEHTSHYVVHGPSPDKPLAVSTIEGAWHRIRERAGIPGVRLHDLRHTVGTYAGQAGANAFLIRDKLGHKTVAMTGRYVQRDTDPLKELSDRVEGRIANAMGGNLGAQVIDIKQAKE